MGKRLDARLEIGTSNWACIEKRMSLSCLPFYGIVRIRLIACMVTATGITSVHRFRILGLSLVFHWLFLAFNYYLCTIRAGSIGVQSTLNVSLSELMILSTKVPFVLRRIMVF